MAVIADIHSNLPALERVLGETKGMKVFCLGDLVGYNPFPNEVVELLRQTNIPSIRGNHDYAVITGDTSWFNPVAARAIEWTRKVITDENLEFLEGLPIIHDNEFYAVHGSPRNPLEEYVFPDYPAEILSGFFEYTESKAMALGHTHIPFVRRLDKGIVFNPGSIGQPRDMNPKASYAVFETGDNYVEIKRVEYGISEVSSAIKEAGLPSLLAERLHVGW